jgi:hypothetical protein
VLRVLGQKYCLEIERIYHHPTRLNSLKVLKCPKNVGPESCKLNEAPTVPA